MPRHGSPLSDSESSEAVFHFEPALPPISTTPGRSGLLQPSAPEPSRSIFSRAREAIAKSKKREVHVEKDNDPFAFTAEDEAPEPVRKKPRRGSPRGTRGKEITARKEDDCPRGTRGKEITSRKEDDCPRGTRGKEITSRKEDDSPRGTRGKEITSRKEDDGSTKTRDASTYRVVEGPSLSNDQSVEDRREEVGISEPASLQEGVGGKRGRQEIGESSESDLPVEQPKRARKDEEAEPKQYKQITHMRSITTITTQVQRVVTVSVIGKESGEVVEVLTWEEDLAPQIENKEEEEEQVHDLLDGSRLTLSSKSRKQQEHQQQSRSSPRIKNGKSPVTTRSASKSVERTSARPLPMATSEKSSSDKGSDVSGNGIGDDHQRRDEPTVEEIPSVTRQATVPVVEDEADLKRSSSSDSSLTPGTRVLAKWLDSYFYPGVITTKQYKNGRYLVTFDDGDKRRIPRENLIVKDLLPAGQSVMAQGDVEDDFYEGGVIVGHYREGNSRGYEIQTQSGAISRFPRSRVILSEQQADAILSSESSVNVTSGTSASIGAHSLRMRKDTGGSAVSSGASAHNITKSGSTSSKDTSDTSSEEKTRGKNAARASKHESPRLTKAATASADITPKSTKKSSHKVKAKARTAGHRIAESESSSDEQRAATASKRRPVKRGLSSSYSAKSPAKPAVNEPFAVPARLSPRKEMFGKEDTAESPCLPRDRNIFAGLAFLVTGVGRDKHEPEESDSESERVEFNREHLKRQIEAGGGVVLSSFTQSQISSAECFLISHTHQRTQKYFQSLASGIPCVSHMWINDSCTCNRRLDYKRYLLPAGESLEEGEIVECRPRRNILGGMRVSGFQLIIQPSGKRQHC